MPKILVAWSDVLAALKALEPIEVAGETHVDALALLDAMDALTGPTPTYVASSGPPVIVNHEATDDTPEPQLQPDVCPSCGHGRHYERVCGAPADGKDGCTCGTIESVNSMVIPEFLASKPPISDRPPIQ